MTRFGLPTYPIVDAMYLGQRDDGEIDWLLEHGVIQTDIYRYQRIAKVRNGLYRLTKQEDDRYDNPEQVIREASTWQALSMGDLSMWRWWPHQDNAR